MVLVIPPLWPYTFTCIHTYIHTYIYIHAGERCGKRGERALQDPEALQADAPKKSTDKGYGKSGTGNMVLGTRTTVMISGGEILILILMSQPATGGRTPVMIVTVMISGEEILILIFMSQPATGGRTPVMIVISGQKLIVSLEVYYVVIIGGREMLERAGESMHPGLMIVGGREMLDPAPATGGRTIRALTDFDRLLTDQINSGLIKDYSGLIPD